MMRIIEYFVQLFCWHKWRYSWEGSFRQPVFEDTLIGNYPCRKVFVVYTCEHCSKTKTLSHLIEYPCVSNSKMLHFNYDRQVWEE